MRGVGAAQVPFLVVEERVVATKLAGSGVAD